MRFVFDWGFTVPVGKAGDMQAWLEANEEKLAAAAPDGWRYVGTYAAVMTSEKHAGGFHALWELDSYGAQDALSDAMKEGGTFAMLMDEFTRTFIDQDPKADWSNTLLRNVRETAIWGE